MWKYQKEIIEIRNPKGFEIINQMNKIGEDGWEIFSITEKVVEEWKVYGEKHEIVQYTLYMKKIEE